MVDNLYCADLHVHTFYSRDIRPQWFFRQMGIAECYTSPRQVYALARTRNMDFVTITDHDTINGVLEIAHLEGVFTGVEITTGFPEEPGVIHVVALGFTEAQYREIRICQENIYNLVNYLNREGITHFLAHPFYAGGARLSVAALEKLFLLFKNLEGLNGSRSVHHRALLDGILQKLTPEHINEWANRYGIEPVGSDPHRKSLVGGSDDHAGLAVARAYTACHQTPASEAFLAAIRNGVSKPCGEVGTSLSLAASVYGMAYRFFEKRDKVEKSDNIYRWFFSRFVPSFRKKHPSSPLDTILRKRLPNFLAKHPYLAPVDLLKSGHRDRSYRILFEGINELFNQVLGDCCQTLASDISALDLERLFQTLGQIASVHFFLGAYYGAFSHQNGDHGYLEETARQFGVASAFTRPRKVAIFSDCAYEVNGVALSLQRMLKVSRETNQAMFLITCSDRPSQIGENTVSFQAVAHFPMPHYEGMRLFVPPFLEMLDWCEQAEITTVQISTPGPVGMAGLLIARLLNLPTVGFYHTNIPDLVRDLTKDVTLGRWAEAYTGWFYRQMETVFVSSRSSMNDLTDLGIAANRIRLVPRGVDPDVFCPTWRNPSIWARYQVNGDLKLLYVGRMSREKGLDLLAESFKHLVSSTTGVHLIMVGDGPYREYLERSLADYNVSFTGIVEGEALSEIYASSDLFVFPSSVDTFGNVVLEAQASGLPVLVSSRGGACENIQPGITGMVVEGRPEAFSAAAQRLLADPIQRGKMGKAARAYAQGRDMRKAFLQMWEMYPGGVSS